MYKYKYKLQPNNLDLLRLLLASAVVILHLSYLTQDPVIAFYSEKLEFISGRAVQGFFIVSGFLIYMSYEKSKSVKRYFWNRFLRIYPAYICLLILCSFYFILSSDMNISEFFSKEWLKYIVGNLTFLNFIQPTLDGVFDNNSSQIINGSLWTLKIEVMFYFIVPFLFVLFNKFGVVKGSLVIYLLSLSYIFILNTAYENYKLDLFRVLLNQLPAQLIYFIAGVLGYFYFELIKDKIIYCFIFSIFVFIFQVSSLEPLALMIILVYFFMMTTFIIDLRKMGDLSYGVYIFHFPLIQIFISFNFLQNQPLLFIGFIYLITYLLSALSWFLIEKNAIKFKNINFSNFK